MPTLTAVDQWILTRFDEVIKAYHKAFEKYEFFPARNALEQFFWSDFCDNYIELVNTVFMETKLRKTQKRRVGLFTKFNLVLSSSSLLTCRTSVKKSIRMFSVIAKVISPFILPSSLQFLLKQYVKKAKKPVATSRTRYACSYLQVQE